MALFTVDWEPWYSFKPYSKYWEENDPMVVEPTYYLLDLLKRHQVKAIFYCVGWLKDRHPTLIMDMEREGHIIGDHTYYHEGTHGKQPFRAPRFKGQKRLYSGGFWFRLLPYKWIKKLVEKEGIFFIHPHDLLEDHPDCGNAFKTFERKIGLKTVRDKLERLIREVKFGTP